MLYVCVFPVFMFQQCIYNINHINVSYVLNISILVQNVEYLCPAEATWLRHSFYLLQ